MPVNINIGFVANAAGTVNAITAVYAPAFTVLTDKDIVAFVATGANTSTTPTFSPNGLAAKTIVKHDNQPLTRGDIAGLYATYWVEYNSTLDKWVLLNPQYDRDTFVDIVSTTDATVTTLQTIPIPTDSGMIIETRVTSRKTAGAGLGTVGDVNGYIRTVKAKNVAGVISIGVIQATFTSEDIAPFGITFLASGTNVLVNIQGSATNNVDWKCETKITRT